MVSLDLRLTYEQYCLHVLEVANKLRYFEINSGDRVGIVSPNCLEYVVLLMALWSLGAIAVPISIRWPAANIERSLEEVNCSHVILSFRLSSQPILSRYEAIYLEDIVQIRPELSGRSYESQPGMDLEQDATIIFTSGSSGRPKPVLHGLGNHYYSALGSNVNISFGPGKCWLISLPLYHVGGLAILFRAALGGGAVSIQDENSGLQDNIRKMGITHISLVETQLYRLLEERGGLNLLRGLKSILVGGGPVSPDLVGKAAGVGLSIFTSYGSTEMASQITTTRPHDDLDRLLTSGKVLPYRQIKIAPDGEILVKGATLFKGYLERDLLVTGRDDLGWFRTGDLGYMDDLGYLVVTGRKDNMFISGGENIQPEEIENKMNQLDGVANAIVVPVRNKEYGERPAAFVMMEAGRDFDRQDLEQGLKNILPHFMVPDYFFPWPEDMVQNGLKINREYFRKIAESNIIGRWDGDDCKG